jgi:putative cell wall-binding protein
VTGTGQPAQQAWADSLPDVQAGQTLSGGSYHIANGAAGTITVADGAQVTLVGNGIGSSSFPITPYNGLTIRVNNGATLTLQDAWLSTRSSAGFEPDNLIDVAGDATINIQGSVILENRNNGNKAVIHVPATSKATFTGDEHSRLYLYKNGPASGIGSDAIVRDPVSRQITNPSESSGQMVFASGNYYAFGNNAGAVIGNSNGVTPAGDISFEGAVVYVYANAMGAAIGASGGSAATAYYADYHPLAGDVYLKAGQLYVWSDWQGSAIGRGGGNGLAVDVEGGAHNSDHSYAGRLIVTGGSLKSLVSPNSSTYWLGGSAVTQLLPTLGNITAAVQDGAGNELALYQLDLGIQAFTGDSIAVTVDGAPFYEGTAYRHQFKEVYEITDCWPPESRDPYLYLLLTKGHHVIGFGDDAVSIDWNNVTGTFETSGGATASSWDGTIDVSWYDPSSTEFVITRPAQLAGLAAIVNGIYNPQASVVGNRSLIVDNVLDQGTANERHHGADDFRDKTVRLGADLNMGGSFDTGTGTWVGPSYAPVGGEFLMDLTDVSTRVDASFNGIFEGNGYVVSGVNAQRDSSLLAGGAVGLIGRLGRHISNDGVSTGLADEPTSPVSEFATPTIRDVQVSGAFAGTGAVGGIVGAADYATQGVLIERCANSAQIDNKGEGFAGGIAGTLIGGARIQDCYNMGMVTSHLALASTDSGAGGIAGRIAGSIANTYNIQIVYAVNGNDASLGTFMPGAQASRSYWLDGTAAGGGMRGQGASMITDVASKTTTEMQASAFLSLINGNAAFGSDNLMLNSGYPVLALQNATDITTAAIAALADVLYTGSPVTPTPAITYGGTALAQGTDFVMGYLNNERPGRAIALVYGRGIYRGVAALPFMILPASTDQLAVTLERAQAACTGVAVSGDGSDVPSGTWWVAQRRADYFYELNALVARAQALVGDPLALQADVDALTGELDAATNLFNRVKTLKDPPDTSWVRLSGNDRYDTMKDIIIGPNSGAFTAADTDTVIVADGTNFPDALAASGLAGITGAPVVLTTPDALSAQAEEVIRTLQPSTVYIAGGTGSVSEAVASSLSSLLGSSGQVIRSAGSGRAETALDIYAKGKAAGVWGTTAVIADGMNYPDALSISPISFLAKAPIFLSTPAEGLTAETIATLKAAIADGSITRVLIVGGTGSVPDSVKTQLGYAADDTALFTRLGGATRYETSTLIVEYAIQNMPTINYQQIAVATGSNYPDALAGGAFAGKKGTVLLLVDDEGGMAGVQDIVGKYRDQIGFGHIFGGTGSVSETMKGALEAAARG